MSEQKAINAKSPKLDRETTVYSQAPTTVDEGTEMFGGDAVNSNAVANWVVTLQAAIRRMHIAKKSDEEIMTELAEAKMGVATSGGRIDPIQASLAVFKLMNEEEKQAYLNKLQVAAESAE